MYMHRRPSLSKLIQQLVSVSGKMGARLADAFAEVSYVNVTVNSTTTAV